MRNRMEAAPWSMKRQCLKPTIKYGGGAVMAWECMTVNGVSKLASIDGTMYKEQYEKIFLENVDHQQRNLKCDPSFSNKTTTQSVQPER